MSTVTRRVSHVILLLVILLAILAARAAANGPVIWKQHCPRWYDVVTIPDKAGDGVHVQCVRAADATER
ncbi:MAG TPA: hypothetical protein PK170_07980 [Anaerolineae bacterium]|jgi:hypothetical protein|nr:hypothetical protein [Anaerolineae bacterium]